MPQYSGHSIVLGGVGGDSHSVGLSILRQALGAAGCQVHYLGIQNRIMDFIGLAPFADLMMLSCMDGHARHYLRNFPEMKCQGLIKGGALWYLGGNLAGGGSLAWEKMFLDMGFDRVFVKFVDVETVLTTIRRDLGQTPPRRIPYGVIRDSLPTAPSLDSELAETPLPVDEFLPQRGGVLGQWKTGRQANDLEANAVTLRDAPNFSAVQAGVNLRGGPPLIQPRSGVPLIKDQIVHFEAFKSVGARVLSFQVDSFTRNNNYLGAEEAIRESFKGGVPALNGFPVVNYGPAGVRRVLHTVGLPLQTRHSTRDPRLLCEVSYAGGVTAFEGGPISYNIPYYKDYSLEESMARWRYVDRLTGLYQARYGVTLDREYFGVLTGTLIPPCLAIVSGILEAVLAVKQGVKCVSLGWAEQGHRVQDVAAVQVMGEMAKGVLSRLGHQQVQVNTIFHQYMAAFPPLPNQAEELILNSARTAKACAPTRILCKTPVEAYKIPTMADNLHGLSLVMAGLAPESPEVDSRALALEKEMIRHAAQSILDSVIMAGGGSVAAGICAGFKEGLLDIPFSPSVFNRGEVITARDVEGAVRFAAFGGLDLPLEVRQYHQDKMGDRRRREGLKSSQQDYLLVERDVLQLARGQYESWPLYG